MKLLYPSLALFLFACRSEDGVKAYNSEPQVTITSHAEGAEIQDGYIITFVGQVSDANHQNSQLLVTWSTDNGELCSDLTPEDNGETICEAVLTEDDTELRLQAVDPEGGAGVQTINITILPTEAPTAEIISPLPSGVYYSDQKITFEGLIEDEEDDSELLVAIWESDLDGELDVEAEADTEGSILGFGYLTEGEHAVKLYVEDTTGKTDTASVIINVGPPNTAPSCEITSPTSGSAGPENQTIDFMAAVSDVDIPSNQLTVAWNSDKDGDLGTSTPNSSGDVLFSFSDLSVNTHTITMTVTDEIGASCTDFISYTIGTPPEITLDSPLDGEVFAESSSINFTAMVSDAQDLPNDIALDWTLNGTSVSTQGATSSGTATWSDSSLTFGSYTLVVTATDTDGLNDSAQATFTVNGIPSAPEISITPDPATTSNQLTANIDVASVDPENATISYTYEWYRNNVLESTQTSSVIASSDTAKGETWKVRVTPNDGTSDGDFAEAEITIGNTAPTLSSISITPTGSIYNDDTLTCSVVVTDPDETLTPSYEWSIDGSVIGTGSTIDLGSVGAMPTDDVLCTATVTDDEAETASSNTSKTLDNRAPTLSGTSITPNTGITTSTLLTCSSTTNDDDGEILSPTFTWQVGSNSYTGATLQLDATMVSPNDSITCMADVEDGYGGSASDSTSVSVSNTPPEITASIDVNGSGNSAELTCVGLASDADDSTEPSIAYEWLDNSGTSLGSNNPLQLDSTMGSDGDDISCVATATDSDGDSTSTTVVHTITNTAPVIDSISLSPASPDVNTSALTCNVTGSDADGDTVTFSYEWLVDNQPQSETTNMFTGPFIVGSIIACRSTPSDGKIDGIVEEDTATVVNTAPTVTSVTLNPTTAYTNDVISASVSFSDDDTTQTVTGTYAWHVIDATTGTDTEVLTGSDSVLNGSTHFDKGDEVYVIVTPNDGVDDGAPVTSSSITISNTAPDNINVTLTPNTGLTNDQTLVCSATAFDDDSEDTLSYDYAWSTGATGETITLDSSIAPGSSIECTATATDGSDSVSGVASISVDNRLPVVDSISVTPATPTATTTDFECVVSSSDADGETPSLAYAWSVDGSVLTSETSSTLTASYDYGQEITCEATPSDATGSGTADSASVTIGNTAPVVDVVNFDGNSYYTNDVITATAVVSDIDNSQFLDLNASFEWHILDASDSNTDKVVQSGADNTLDGASHFDRDDEVYVIVTPNDGVDDGSTLTSTSVTVLNTAPTAASISIAPDPAVAGDDDLTCSVDVASTDADGDTIVYTYTWTDQSGIVQQTTTESSSTNDVYLASGTTEGTWTCEVTPYDMTDYATSSSTTVTVESGCSSLYSSGAGDIVVTADNPYSNSDVVEGTASIWVKIESLSSLLFNPIFSIEGWIWLSINQDGNLVGCSDGICTEATGSTNLLDDSWHHLALTWNGTSYTRIYVDGTLESDVIPQNNPNPNRDSNRRLGLAGGAASLSWTQNISANFQEFKIWNTTLSPGDIADLANRTSTLQPNLLDWPLNSYVGSTVIDQSPQGHDGTLLGATWVNSCPEEDLDGDGVAAWEDCDDSDASVSSSGSGTAENCAATSCKTILDDGYSTGDGIYWIDPAGTGAFEAYCDMTTEGGGWTLVGFEKSGDTQTFKFLGINVGSESGIAHRSNSGLIGTHFIGLYSDVLILWDGFFIKFTPSNEIFENTVNLSSPISNFSTNESTLENWVSVAGGAQFCRASLYNSIRPGDTSWAVKPINDNNTNCGCNSGSWTGRGAYYAGHPSSTFCTSYPGGWSGVKDNGAPKGGFSLNYDSFILVR